MTNELIGLRPSAMPRAMLCSASLYPAPGEPLIDVIDEDAGSIGQAAHDILKAVSQNETFNMEEIAAKHSIKVDDIGYLQWAVRQFVELLQAEFTVKEWHSEAPISVSEPFEMKGTPDLWGMVDENTAVLFDLKSGYGTDISHEAQMKAYAYMIFSNNSQVQKVIALIGWARDLEVQKWEWNIEDINKWIAEVQARVLNWNGVDYTVGSHCTFCPRAASCDARARVMNAAQALMVPDASPGALVGKDFAQAWEASIAIPKMIDSWRERVREHILAIGPIDMGEGRKLTLKERNGKPEIDTGKAVQILASELEYTHDEILSCCEIGKKKLEDIAASKAGRGKKGEARKEIGEILETRGALSRKMVKVFTVEKEESNGKAKD